jgi:hypothetical protein
MTAKIIQGMLAAIIGTVAFIAVKALVSGMSTSGWSSGEITIITTVLPLAVAIMALVAVFAGLQRLSE